MKKMTREKDRRRWSLRRLAVTAAVVALCALLAGCGGGDTGDKISAPFESGKCKGMELEVVKSQLAEAGFTNIQEKPQETATEFLADSVISVKIGSNTSWNSANTWKPDTKIIIEYYAYTGIRHIDVTKEYAGSRDDILYKDSMVYIPEKDETEPARILTTIFKDDGEKFFELTVATPSIEKDDLKDAMAGWMIFLYIALLLTIIVINVWVFYRNMRPLYVLLHWLDKYRIGKGNEPLQNNTRVSEFRK